MVRQVYLCLRKLLILKGNKSIPDRLLAVTTSCKPGSPNPSTGDADHSPALADAPIMDYAGLTPARVEEIRGPVQIAAVAQDFADIFPAALPRAADFHLAAPHSRRHRRHSSPRAGSPVLRVGPAGGRGQRRGRPRPLSRPVVEPRHPAAHALSGPLLLRLDLPHGHAATLCG